MRQYPSWVPAGIPEEHKQALVDATSAEVMQAKCSEPVPQNSAELAAKLYQAKHPEPEGNCLGITILEYSVLVEVESEGETETLEFQVCPNVICKGDTLFGGKPPHPGVQWNGAFYPFMHAWDSVADTIAYLINEGQIVADTIEGDNEQPAVTWRVQPASIAVLRKHGVIQ